MYEDLETVAGLRIAKTKEKLALQQSETMIRIREECAVRGLLHSSPFENAKLQLGLDLAEGVCREVYNVWRGLILRKEGALSEGAVAFVVGKVEEIARQQARSIEESLQSSGQMMLPAGINQQLEGRLQGIVAAIRRELEIERREAELLPPGQDSTQQSREAFVIMASSEDLKPIYEEAIAPAIRQNGLEPFLMVRREPQSTISHEILSRIESARLILADLTHERPNCYYEVGYAHASGKKVIFLAREDHDPRRPDRRPQDAKIHFDLARISDLKIGDKGVEDMHRLCSCVN